MERSGASNDIDFLKSLRQQLIDSFNSKWKDALRRSNRGSLHRTMKSFPQDEMYLYSMDKKVFRDVWICFRMGSVICMCISIDITQK